MPVSEQARRNHDELFPGRVSTLKQTDPELIEYFDNFGAVDDHPADPHGEGAHRSEGDSRRGGRRRAQRLRASGQPYPIVRPGWFDSNRPDQHRLVLLQGDTRHAGDPSDGVVARRQIAQVLVHSLNSDPAVRKTFELVAEPGPAPTPENLDTLLASTSRGGGPARDRNAFVTTVIGPAYDQCAAVAEEAAAAGGAGLFA